MPKREFYNRKNPRLKDYDNAEGDYFVTICTMGKKHYFGEITDYEMHLTPIGEYCQSQLQNVKEHYSYADIPLYVVMPNHIHAIIHIADDPRFKTLKRKPLEIVVGGIKRAVTIFANKNNLIFDWQDRYHEHIIRSKRTDGNRICYYIEHNVTSWEEDCFYDEKD